MIDNVYVKEVVNNVAIMTIIIISTYPVIYIIRSMVDFIQKAFRYINVDKVFKSASPFKKLRGR